MSLRIGLACLIAATVAGFGQAQAPPVAVLIRQLGDRDFRTREGAARTLQDLGDVALPELRKAQPHADPDVRRRIAQIISLGERNSLLLPTLV
jgi:HEAT repeat protein